MYGDLHSGVRRVVILLCVGAACAAGGVRPAGAQAADAVIPQQAATILDAKDTFYRWICFSRPAVVAAEAGGAGAAERTTLTGKQIDAKQAAALDGEPPAGWRDAAFDDAAWPRTTVGRLAYVAFHGCRRGPATGETVWNAGVVCLRGKFIVSDPAAVEQLYLAAGFRGGVVVYLNGRAVARGGMPDGELTAGAAALPYPAEAYLDAAGRPLPDASRVKKDDKELAERIASRNRVLGPVALPVGALRRGVNVLAVEVHRSDYASEARQFVEPRFEGGWVPCELLDLRLAAVGAGVTPNCSRPAGLQVWNQDRNDRASVWDYGDPTEPLGPIRLAGARNGVFWGKLVVSSDAALGEVKAEAGQLKQASGDGTIPAAALQVRYAQPMAEFNWMTKWVEPMSPVAPEKVELAKTRAPGAGAMVEVWLAVRVPADAAAGDYAGTLAVSVAGERAAEVPVQLHVADWTLPEPRSFHAFVGIYQSPTAISLTYDVPMWSERHWQLVERSLELLGHLGNQFVQIPVVDRTRLGNDDGMVTWVRKADGTFDYDCSVVERYLKLVRKYMGAPKFVVLHVYHPGGWTPSGPKQTNTVSVQDAATGKREHMQVPEFATDESKAFWTPVFAKLKQVLAAEGMGDCLVIGSLTEANATAAEYKMFADILGPDVRWLRITHRQQGELDRPAPPLSGGGQVMPHIYTYLPGLPSLEGPTVFVHQGYWPRVAYFRRAQGITLPLICHRQFALHSLFLQLPGFSHVCLDFWPVQVGRRDRGGLLWGRWPTANGYPGDPEPAYLTWPGPDGAEPMTAFESLREGLQETQALVVVSRALAENEAALGPELAGRCRQALHDELAFCVSRAPFRYQYFFYDMNHYGWQELSGRVFALAGEVSAKTAAN